MNEAGGLGYEFMDETLPYRRIMCAMITNAIRNAMGYEMSVEDGKNKRIRGQVKTDAIAYVLSDDFEFDMELLGYDSYVNAIRRKVTRGTYQIPLNARMVTA